MPMPRWYVVIERDKVRLRAGVVVHETPGKAVDSALAAIPEDERSGCVTTVSLWQ